MTQTVLYTDDMEPITVLDLSHRQLEFLKKCVFQADGDH